MKQTKYFKCVRAISDYQLEILTETDTHVIFDFRPKFKTIRFMDLGERELFLSAHTDGNYVLFEKEGYMKVKIPAKELLDMALLERSPDVLDKDE